MGEVIKNGTGMGIVMKIAMQDEVRSGIEA